MLDIALRNVEDYSVLWGPMVYHYSNLRKSFLSEGHLLRRLHANV